MKTFLLYNNSFYYIGRSVSLETIPLVEFKRNLISGTRVAYFPYPHYCGYQITSFPAFYGYLCKHSVKNGERLNYLYNKKKIIRWLGDTDVIFSC